MLMMEEDRLGWAGERSCEREVARAVVAINSRTSSMSMHPAVERTGSRTLLVTCQDRSTNGRRCLLRLSERGEDEGRRVIVQHGRELAHEAMKGELHTSY